MLQPSRQAGWSPGGRGLVDWPPRASFGGSPRPRRHAHFARHGSCWWARMPRSPILLVIAIANDRLSRDPVPVRAMILPPRPASSRSATAGPGRGSNAPAHRQTTARRPPCCDRGAGLTTSGGQQPRSPRSRRPPMGSTARADDRPFYTLAELDAVPEVRGRDDQPAGDLRPARIRELFGGRAAHRRSARRARRRSRHRRDDRGDGAGIRR